MIKEKIIFPSPGSRKKGFSQKAVPKYIMTQNSEAIESIRQEYIDPLKWIGHHVSEDTKALQVQDNSDALTRASSSNKRKCGQFQLNI